MLTTPSIFDRYQEVRSRMPQASTVRSTREISALTDIADEVSAFVFDAFGVLNVGETLIKGADHRLDQLRALGRHIRILTNAASYDRTSAVGKFKRLGLRIEPDEIITSRDAALAALTPGLWGAIAAPEDRLADISVDLLRLGDRVEDYDHVEGFLFLSSSGWTPARQDALLASLQREKRQVIIANADLAAPRDHGFSLEPGHFGHLLMDEGIDTVRFFGKPFDEVYNLVEQSLVGVPTDRIAMCGDTLHTDIMGATARNWRTVLVTQDGLFSGHNTVEFCQKSGLHPDWRLARI
jgi:HAD superfamily hydrolase (TIGR01450 family)